MNEERRNLPAPISTNDLEKMAHAIAKSGLFGMKTPEQALALMLIAQAEGRHPALAARDYDIIQGKPSKKTEAMMRDFLENGGKVEWHILTDDQASATFSHPSGGTVTIDWDMERAKTAGLAGKGTWKQYPRQMLRSRVVSEGIRTVAPFATSGMFGPEEVADFAPEPRNITPPKQQGLDPAPSSKGSSNKAKASGSKNKTSTSAHTTDTSLPAMFTTPEPQDDSKCPSCGESALKENANSKTGKHKYFCVKRDGGCGAVLDSSMNVVDRGTEPEPPPAEDENQDGLFDDVALRVKLRGLVEKIVEKSGKDEIYTWKRVTEKNLDFPKELHLVLKDELVSSLNRAEKILRQVSNA